MFPETLLMVTHWGDGILRGECHPKPLTSLNCSGKPARI
jgi:hypothetical protein